MGFIRAFQTNYILSGAAAVMLASSTAFAADRFVDHDATGSNNGLTWANAWTSLQTALTSGSVNHGDTIQIAQGTYKPGTDRADSFVVTKRITIEGGYIGQGANPGTRNVSLYPTILSGNIGNTSISTDNSYQVVTFANPTQDEEDTRLDGVTVTGGYAPGSFAPVYGGGIYIDNGANPRIHNCKINNNYAIGGGGGIAIYRSFGSEMNPAGAVITSCEINNNTVGLAPEEISFGAAGRGAGLMAEGDGHLEMQNCNVHDNTSIGSGGGMILSMVVNTSSPTANIVNCVIRDNTATGGFGEESGLGGGIDVQGANSTPSNGPIVNVLNSTIVENKAVLGGGVYVNKTGTIPTTLRSCIVWNNTDAEICAPSCTSLQLGLKNSTLVVRYSDVMEKDDTDHVDSSVDLGTPDTNIGDIVTTHNPDFVNAAVNDFRIDCGSPCINTGDPSADLAPSSGGFPIDTYDVNENASTTEKVPTVQLLARIYSTEIDMGAYEASAAGLCVADVDDNCVVDVDDLLAIINSWGACSSPCPADVGFISGGDICAEHNGHVDVDDLLTIINSWGPCPGTGCTDTTGVALQDAEDCMDAASLEYDPYSEPWDDFVEKCIDGLRAAGLIP